MGVRILCRHPFNESKRAYVVPQRVEELLKCFWPGRSGAFFLVSKISNMLIHPSNLDVIWENFIILTWVT